MTLAGFLSILGLLFTTAPGLAIFVLWSVLLFAAGIYWYRDRLKKDPVKVLGQIEKAKNLRDDARAFIQMALARAKAELNDQ